jgi:GMP synthase (glutamine-hydrolysing)
VHDFAVPEVPDGSMAIAKGDPLELGRLVRAHGGAMYALRPSMRAIIVQHESHEGAGLFGPALEAAGFTLVKRFRQVSHDDAQAELVVVLGGPMAVYETEAHPFLHHEVALLAERLANGRPSLGICLGAQLLARAAGAEVMLGKNGLELGVAPVRFTKAGLADAVLAPGREKLTVAHWHQDTYLPVPEATLLASTDRYTQQAFRLGDSFGLQFHAELTASELGRWYRESPDTLARSGKTLAALEAELPRLKAVEPQLEALAQRLATHFADAAR